MIRGCLSAFPASCRCSPLGNCYNRGREALPAPFGKERILCGKIVCSVWDWCFACCAELSAPEEQSPCSQMVSYRRPVRAKRKRHPCGCLLSEVFSVGLQGMAVRLGFAGSGSLAVSGQFQIERRQIQGGVQGIQMGALHAMGGVYARADESSPAVHTGVPGSTDI